MEKCENCKGTGHLVKVLQSQYNLLEMNYQIWVVHCEICQGTGEVKHEESVTSV